MGGAGSESAPPSLCDAMVRATLSAIVAAVLAAGCGGSHHSTAGRGHVEAAAPERLRVGVVGPLQITAAGAVFRHGSLGEVAGEPLVFGAAGAGTPAGGGGAGGGRA